MHNRLMDAKAGVSVAEYLSTVYEPDCDYVDGEIQERNVGERDHARVAMAIAAYLFSRREQLGIDVLPEIRVQVRPERFRVPDVCVAKVPMADEQILRHPPFLCVEVLSPEDRMSRVLEKIEDYLSFGVPYVWLVDPRTREALVYTPGEIRKVTDGVLRTENPDLAVPLKEIFAGLC